MRKVPAVGQPGNNSFFQQQLMHTHHNTNTPTFKLCQKQIILFNNNNNAWYFLLNTLSLSVLAAEFEITSVYVPPADLVLDSLKKV